jgi:hypothetical protein
MSPAIRRATLCSKHSKGERDDAEVNVRPPVGSAQCSVCRVETAQAVAAREQGTMSRSGLVSAYAPDNDFPVKSSQARLRIDALMTQQQRERADADAAVADMDAERQETVALDRARAGKERIDLYRKQRRMTRVPRPRFSHD